MNDKELAAKKNEVLEILKKGMESYSGTVFGKRLETHLQSFFGPRETSDEEKEKGIYRPYVSIYAPKSAYESSVIRVWYASMKYIEVRFYLKDLSGEKRADFREAILNDIERQFTYDVEQRASAEAQYHATFESIEEEIKALQEKARGIIEALPIPSRATIRKDASFWSSASADLRKRFPLCFG